MANQQVFYCDTVYRWDGKKHRPSTNYTDGSKPKRTPIIVEDGIITSLDPKNIKEGTEVIEYSKMTAIPGGVSIHCHGAGNGNNSCVFH